MDITNLKSLTVVLALACGTFAALRPLCLQYMRPETFRRRRNVWFALTTVAFLSPSFGIYALFAIGLLLWAGRKDDNPLALYALLTFVVPDARFYIPTVLIGQIFDITQYRLLSLFVLVPFVLRFWFQRRATGQTLFNGYDGALLGFLLIYVVTNIPYESATATMRHAFLLTIDCFVVYYAFSRIDGTHRIQDVMACFCLAAGIMAPIAIFEWSKGWLLYTGLASAWGDPNVFSWLVRGDRLRALAATQGPLTLGYQLAMGLCFLIFLQAGLRMPMLKRAAVAVFVFGLYTTASRGPWLTALIAILVLVALRPGSVRKLTGLAITLSSCVLVAYFTPLRETVIERLPIIGTMDQETVDYRRQLADLSWVLISRHPLFGDPFVASQMESMRQGQGIIDIVNGYLFTLLFTGCVGMTLQGIWYIGALVGGSRRFFQVRSLPGSFGSQGAALLACCVGTLFFIATAGYGSTTYLLFGLLYAYAKTSNERLPAARVGTFRFPTALAE